MISRSIVFRNGRFYIDGTFILCDVKVIKGIIAEISHRIDSSPKDISVDLQGQCVIPGLINAHDHLEFNLFPPLGNPPYANYLEWTKDVRSNNTEIINEVLSVPLKYRLLWGAYKNIFSGVTTIVHHNQYYQHFYFNFPIEVFRNYNWIHSLELDPGLSKKLSKSSKKPLMIHIAEGTDETAKGELRKLYELNGLTERTIIVHGIGLTEEDILLVEQYQTPLIWCPSSNNFLYNATAPIKQLIGKIPIALGTDSAISNGISMFKEMREARKITQLSLSDILDMATRSPAAMFNIQKGRVETGASADFLIFESIELNPLEAVLTLNPSNYRCLVRNGFPIYGDIEFKNFFLASKGKLSKIVIDDQEKFITGNFTKVANMVKKHFSSFSWQSLGLQKVKY